MHLPVLVAFGGVCPTGRSSSGRAYERLVYDLLDTDSRQQVLQSLSAMTGIATTDEQGLLDSTGVRKISPARFDVERIPAHLPLAPDTIASLELRDEAAAAKLSGWEPSHKGQWVPSDKASQLWTEHFRPLPCRSAGQLPEGFKPGSFYPSRQHPLALEMTVFGMSDALGNLGLDWEELSQRLAPDRIAVISGSAISQVDDLGIGNYLKARLQGSRPSSRSLAMGLGEMSAGFINAYILGTFGVTGNYTGACATWLYNLSAASDLIRSGQIDLAVVGAAESQVNSGIIEAFHSASAMASDEKLLALQASQGDSASEVAYRRACRPFAENVGMIVGESAQFAILMSDRLALETGADIHAGVLSTHISADGNKYSISSPGAGNYISVAKALAEAKAIVGEKMLRQQSVMLAHGTGTPQNRVTESHILDYCAGAFGIKNWPVAAIKSVLGHSMGCAGGDQAMAALGITSRGFLPGIHTASDPAADVHRQNLDILFQSRQCDPEQTQLVFLNAKGFGGNNATSALLGAQSTLDLLRQRHGPEAVARWQKQSERARQNARDYDSDCQKGQFRVHYRHGENVRNGIEGDVRIEDEEMRLKGLAQPISLQFDNPFDTDG